MPDSIRSTFQSAPVPWTLAAVLLVAFLLVLSGAIEIHPPSSGSNAVYADISSRLAAEDRSQPLRMKLDGQYPGPLKDTTIQRWHDPVDGTVCYVYLAVFVPHSAGPPGYVQYGQADTGAISCLRPGK
jgi:hypothetical protein